MLPRSTPLFTHAFRLFKRERNQQDEERLCFLVCSVRLVLWGNVVGGPVCWVQGGATTTDRGFLRAFRIGQFTRLDDLRACHTIFSSEAADVALSAMPCITYINAKHSSMSQYCNDGKLKQKRNSQPEWFKVYSLLLIFT